MMSSISSSMASSWASKLFTQLDTKNQGYIEQSDLESAYSKISDSSTSVEDVFSQLDGDSDGKVTKDEITTALQQIADELDSQFNSMRMHGPGDQGGMGEMNGMPPPPPPPPESDTGFTKEELASQLEEIGDADRKRSALISSVIENFDEADSDGDGKVSFKEAMTLDQSNQSGSATSSTDSSDASSSTSSAENDVMMKIMQLMQAYQVFGQDSDDNGIASVLSITA